MRNILFFVAIVAFSANVFATQPAKDAFNPAPFTTHFDNGTLDGWVILGSNLSYGSTIAGQNSIGIYFYGTLGTNDGVRLGNVVSPGEVSFWFKDFLSSAYVQVRFDGSDVGSPNYYTQGAKGLDWQQFTVPVQDPGAGDLDLVFGNGVNYSSGYLDEVAVTLYSEPVPISNWALYITIGAIFLTLVGSQIRKFF